MIQPVGSNAWTLTQMQSRAGVAGAQGRGAPPDPVKAMEPVAELLGLTTGELRSKIEGGASLSDRAEEAGISRDDLVAAITEGIESTAPAGFAGDVAEMANRIADRQGPPPPPPGPPPGARELNSGSVGDVSAAARSLLGGVADLLEIDVDELLERLETGDTSLGVLAGDEGVSAEDILGAFRQGLLVDQLA